MSPGKEPREKALKLAEHNCAEVADLEEAAFVAELDRRAAEVETGAVKVILWEELWAELQREPQRTEAPPALGIAETGLAAT